MLPQTAVTSNDRSQLRAHPVLRSWIVLSRWMLGLPYVLAAPAKIAGQEFARGVHDPQIHVFFAHLAATGPLWRLMGVGQLVAGGLLLLRRTAAAGTLAALPVTAGVLATLWALPFHAADRVAGAILAVMLVSLVAWEYPRWAPLFGAAPEGEIALAALSPGWRRAGVGAAAVAAVGLCGIALWHAVLRHR